MFSPDTPAARANGAKIVQLGNRRMLPGGSTAQEPEGAPEQSIEKVQWLLGEALSMVDALQLPPEIGARLQEVLNRVAELD